MSNHTISTTCPKCGKPLTLDAGEVDGEMADILREIAKRVICDQCATPEPIPGPDTGNTYPPAIDQPEPDAHPTRRQFAAEIAGEALPAVDERLAGAGGRLIDIEPVKGSRWRVRYLAPERISFANE